MYLKELEITGFKSFGKKTALPFEAPITAIVGPNGSGKSNVAEAFRWVLGEQSLKSLRGKRGEDLIFNGAGASSRLNHAAVSVTFDNRERKFNIDFDEVTIAREVFRDGSNEYKINGSQVRLRDVIELLSAVSLGQSGHHIISQGEADRILSANIVERRTMIEEALGLKIYQWKIAESEKKLEKTEENMKELEALRREIAPHIKFLKKQVEKIERADEMRRELKALYLGYFAAEYTYLEHTKHELHQAKSAPASELSKVEERLQKLQAALLGGTADSPKNAELMELERTLNTIRNDKDDLARKLGRLEGVMEVKEERLALARAEGVGQMVPFSQVAALIKSIEVKISEAEESEEVGTIKKVLTAIRELARSFSSSHQAEDKSASLEAELKASKDEQHNLELHARELDKREREATDRSGRLKRELEAEREATRGAEREIFELRSRKTELHSALERTKADEERLALEEENFKRELAEGAALVDREVLEFNKDKKTHIERREQESNRKQIEKLKIRLEDMGVEGTDVMEEYKSATERETFLTRELEDLLKTAESLRQIMRDLSEKLDREFKEGITKINKEFQNFFGLMFGGGNASLQVINPEKRKKKDDLTELTSDMLEASLSAEAFEETETKAGIDVNVSLPRKKIRGLQMLSGGERALTSIALLFAMSQVNPPPFLILDETDAALDEANSRKYGDMVESLAKYSQLIVITHNRETMSRASVLYGVTMSSDGVSKLLSIKFNDATTYAK